MWVEKIIRQKLAEKLKYYRERANLTIYDVGNMIQKSGKTVSAWENGRGQPDADMLIKLCSIYKIDNISELFGEEINYSNIYPIKTKKIPLLGEIACGKPIFANEERELYIDANESIQADFCLECKGDSMIGARIYNGDIVFIKSQPVVENGEIAAVIIDDEATLKRVYYYRENNKLSLVAENSKYPPLIYEGEELDHVRILGKAVAFQSRVN